jgi:hypothetical protein
VDRSGCLAGVLYFTVNHAYHLISSTFIYDFHLAFDFSSEGWELTFSSGTRVASRDDWSFLREMIPVAIPLSVASEKRAQKETATAASPRPPTNSYLLRSVSKSK